MNNVPGLQMNKRHRKQTVFAVGVLIILGFLGTSLLSTSVHAQVPIKIEKIKIGAIDLFTGWNTARNLYLELKQRLQLDEKSLIDATEHLDEVNARIKELRGEIPKLKGAERKAAQAELNVARGKVEELRGQIKEVEATIEETKSALSSAVLVYKESKKKLRIGYWVFLQRSFYFIAFFTIVFLISFFIRRYISRVVEDPARVYKIQRTTKFVTAMFVLLAILIFLIGEVKGALTLLGLIGAGIAIALQDVFKSLVGWVILVTGKGIRPGDRIQVGDVVGDVIEIGPLRTRLLEAGAWMEGDAATGRGIWLTNNFVFNQPVKNYHFGFNYIWKQMEVTATFESDWLGILGDLKSIIENTTKDIFTAANIEIHKMCLQQNLPYKSHEPHVYMTIADSGYKYTLRFLTPPQGILALRHTVSTHIAELFEKNSKYEFAYPTQRLIPTTPPNAPIELKQVS